MKTIKGTIRFKGNVYKYSVDFSQRSKGCEFKIASLLGSNGEAITASNDSSDIEKLVLANARLLKWCKDEGWQLYPSKGEPSGFARCPDGYTQRIRKVDLIEPPQTMTEPIIVELLNWSEELVGEPVFYKAGGSHCAP